LIGLSNLSTLATLHQRLSRSTEASRCCRSHEKARPCPSTSCYRRRIRKKSRGHCSGHPIYIVQINNSSILTQNNPSSHADVIAKYSNASPADVKKAIDAALAAKPAWESLPFAERASVFLKAADLIATKYRYDIMAATMVGQGKNAWQAEIDAAAELCDFLRFNVKYAEDTYGHQPTHNSPGVWKYV